MVKVLITSGDAGSLSWIRGFLSAFMFNIERDLATRQFLKGVTFSYFSSPERKRGKGNKSWKRKSNKRRKPARLRKH